MGRYWVLEKNLVTNEWIDRGWQEARGQHAAIKAHNGGKVEGKFAAVPESSWHPVNIQRREVVAYSITEDGDAELTGEGEVEADAG